MNFEINQSKLTDETKKMIFQGFQRQAIQAKGIDGLSEEPISFEIFDHGEFVGAIVVQLFWEQLHIKYLFVEERFRGRGIARRLMNYALEFGEKRGCQFAFVETMSFQAPEFYQKMGFTIEFSRPGYGSNTTFHYLRKSLDEKSQQIVEENNYLIHQLDAFSAEKACRAITATLPEWFGIPEANERYAIGVRERTSFALSMNDQYVGMISIEMPFPNNANIYWMGVVKNYHRKGVGKALLKYAEAFCRKKCCQSWTVETLSPREKDANYLTTYDFYIKAGFRPLFELHTYGPEFAMVYLQKTLN